MTSAKIKHGSLIPRYSDIGNSSGFYSILPGYPNYICLSETLLEGSEKVHQFVYQTLLDYHNSIPADSKLRVFKHVCYFEWLAELPVREGLVLKELPPVVIGRAMEEIQLIQQYLPPLGSTGRARPWRIARSDERVRIIG